MVPPTLANYWEVLFADKVGPALVSSIIVAVCTTALAVGLGTPAAYALAGSSSGQTGPVVLVHHQPLRQPGGAGLSGVPDRPPDRVARHASGADPDVSDLYPAHRDLDLPTSSAAFRANWTRPRCFEGANQWRIFRSICLPLAMPGVAVSSILSFIFSWNELLFAYILAPRPPRPRRRWP